MHFSIRIKAMHKQLVKEKGMGRRVNTITEIKAWLSKSKKKHGGGGSNGKSNFKAAKTEIHRTARYRNMDKQICNSK